MADYDGEYHQQPLQPDVHELDSCGCLKPPGCYGRHGWHFNGDGAAYERCPAYEAAVKRSGGRRTTKRRRR
jgi:hypothetical protein